jgi:hypothetical protein
MKPSTSVFICFLSKSHLNNQNVAVYLRSGRYDASFESVPGGAEKMRVSFSSLDEVYDWWFSIAGSNGLSKLKTLAETD